MALMSRSFSSSETAVSEEDESEVYDRTPNLDMSTVWAALASPALVLNLTGNTGAGAPPDQPGTEALTRCLLDTNCDMVTDNASLLRGSVPAIPQRSISAAPTDQQTELARLCAAIRAVKDAPKVFSQLPDELLKRFLYSEDMDFEDVSREYFSPPVTGEDG